MTQGTRFGGAGIPWVDLNQDWLTFRGVRGIPLWNAYGDVMLIRFAVNNNIFLYNICMTVLMDDAGLMC